MESNQQLVENFLKKLTRSQKLQIAYGNEKLDTILSQVNAPENSRQQIANTQSGFQPLASIITERLDSIQINESNNYLREETKEECQEDTTENKADKPLTSLQRDGQSKEDKRKKKYSRVETLHSLGYSVKEIAQDSQVNMSLSTVKRLKSKIKAHGSIMREEGSGRPEKLSEIHKNYILKLIADSPFNTSNRIAIKLKNNYEVEVHRSTISLFLVEKGYK